MTQGWTYNSRLQTRQMTATNASSQQQLSLRLAYAPTYDANAFEETVSTNNGNPRVEQLDYTVGATSSPPEAETYLPIYQFIGAKSPLTAPQSGVRIGARLRSFQTISRSPRQGSGDKLIFLTPIPDGLRINYCNTCSCEIWRLF